MSKCIRCFVEHNRMWDGEHAARFCEDCAQVKRDSVDAVDQIDDNLFVSGIQAAAKFEGKRICVHERVPEYGGDFHHCPILVKRPNSDLDRTGALASIGNLELVCDLIEYYLEKNERVLVHCVGGVERSPLTLAYFLTVRMKKFDTLQEAYDMMKEKRPVISERLFWMPEH